MELHSLLARYCLQWSLPSSFTAPERYSRLPDHQSFSQTVLLSSGVRFSFCGNQDPCDISIAGIINHYLGERELPDNVGLLHCLRLVPQYLAPTNGRPLQEPTWVTRSDRYLGLLHLSGGHDLPDHGGCVLQGWDRIPFKCKASSIPGCLSFLH